jgi:MraZ protein
MGITPEKVEKSMFIGEHIFSIDKKRRISIPAKFRRGLGKKAVVTRGLGNCLVLYPMPEWEKLAQKLQNLPAAKGEARGFVRILLSGAADVGLDKLGRILIPDYLANYAVLKKNVAIIGLGNRIEIWDEKKWQEYKAKMETKVEDIAEKLEELGI